MTQDTLRIQSRGAVVRVSVHVQPRSSRSEIVGLHGAALKVRLQSPPVDGAANASLETLLAERLGIPLRNVRVVAGVASRAKTVEIHGTTEDAVRRLVLHGET